MWYDDIDLSFIRNASNFITEYKAKRNRFIYRSKNYKLLLHKIHDVLNIWTGYTYIGKKKDQDLSDAFQEFFSSFHDLLVHFKSNTASITKQERNLMDSVMYNGQVYRYIGTSDCLNKHVVKPEYNNIYVSWSKEKQSDDIEKELYGTVTWIPANIKMPYFGIDLEGFDSIYRKSTHKRHPVSKANEREVVFPTIEDCVDKNNIIYIKEDLE